MRQPSEGSDTPSSPFNSGGINKAYHSAFSAYKRESDVALTELGANVEGVVQIKPFFKSYIWGTIPDVAGYVIQTKDEIIVAYRGTKNIYDAVLRDLKGGGVLLAPTTFGHDSKVHLVHSGFLTDYESSKDSCLGVLNALMVKCPELPVSFTGHSLGGAVAQLAAVNFASVSEAQNEKLKSVYTFGAPRVFASGSSADAYNIKAGPKTLHVVCDGDPISGIPFASLGFERTGYKTTIQTVFSGLNRHSGKSYGEAINTIPQTPEGINMKESTKNSTSIWANFRLYLIGIGTGAKDFWTGLIKQSKPSDSLSKSIKLLESTKPSLLITPDNSNAKEAEDPLIHLPPSPK